MTVPASGLLRAAYPTEIAEALDRYPPDRKASAVISLLYLAQAGYGHLGAEAVAEVADIVGVAPSRVRGLIGFYTLLRFAPHGGYLIQFCTDLPCALSGARELMGHLCARLGIAPGQTTPDGVFTVEEVMCLAACHHAPAMEVNLAYAYDLDEPMLDAIVDDLRQRAAEGLERRPPFGFGPPALPVRPEEGSPSA